LEGCLNLTLRYTSFHLGRCAFASLRYAHSRIIRDIRFGARLAPHPNCELAKVLTMIDKKLLAKIKKMADSFEWGVREDAAVEIKKINDKFFLEYLPIWKKWVADPNPNIRRAVEVGLLRIKKEFIPHALDLLDPLMYDNTTYVRKNCGPFVLSHVGYKDPDITFKRLIKWMKIKDKNVRWNVAMCLGIWFGQSNPEKSLKLLKVLAIDQEKFVWRAVASSLVKLIRKHPKLKQEVFSWKDCEDCLAVVKHYIK